MGDLEKAFDEIVEEATKPTSTITPTNITTNTTKKDNRYNEKYYHIIDMIKQQFPELQYTEDKNKCPTFIHPKTKKVVIKILPRLNCWYGVWRRIDNDVKSKFKAYRVKTQEQETEVLNHIREIIAALNDLASQTFEDIVAKEAEE